MVPWETVTAIICAVFASTGFWTLISNVYNNCHNKKSAETKLLIGLAHHVIFEKCEKYIERGHITPMEYEDLLCIFEPYTESGGNGTGTLLVKAVGDLPIRDE